MKTITLTDFRKNASDFITEVNRGERLIILRHGKPVAEVIPFSDKSQQTPSWKQPGIRLQIPECGLSSAILEARESDMA